MDVSEVFKQNLRARLKAMGRGAQARCAEAVGISTQHLNDYLKGRKTLGEEARTRAAHFVGQPYWQMIKPDTEQPNEPAAEPWQRDLLKSTLHVLRQPGPYGGKDGALASMITTMAEQAKKRGE